MANLPIVVIPFLALCIVVLCTVLWVSFKDRKLKTFAAAEGIAYLRRGQPPMVVPHVVYGRRSLSEMKTFLYGDWHDVEVFACNFQIGWGRGSVQWLFMVAVHAELHDTSGLDLKRWNLTPLNGWTFLVPRKPKGGTLTIGKVRALWDALSAAVPHMNPSTAVTI